MSQGLKHDDPSSPAIGLPDRRWIDLTRSWAVFRWLVVIATAWFLLKELAPLLRPLLMGIFLAYIVLPVRLYVKGQVRGGAGHLALLIGLGIVVAALGVKAYGDIVDLSREVPHLQERAREFAAQVSRHAGEQAPRWLGTMFGTSAAGELSTDRLQEALRSLANVTAGVLVEALEVIFFLTLILFEARRFPQRMRNAFPDEQAEQILGTIASINEAIASYLKVKVKASLVLAIPAMIVLWAFGIKFVVLWGALTFLANFVPYLGSIVACSLPILFGFLDLDFGWQPLAAAVLLVSVHTLSAYLIEPAMTGKAVNLSPLVVLIALSFWGLCWGLIGMVLAVPLTAMLKIILESWPSTRPIARLMGED